ncbi:MAG: hypothetical protein AAGF44_00810 [Pseudomonadota bacterium]
MKMRLLAGVLWFFLGFVSGLLPDGARAQDVLDGRYNGALEAEGARIEITPDAEGFRGTFFDRAGRSQDFAADRLGVLAEAVLDMGGETVLLRMDPKPYGADVALIPLDAEGQMQMARARFLTFLRPGLEMPEPSKAYVSPPTDARGRITGLGFLASYEFWPAEGVRLGYLSLPPRFQTLMQLFPAVQLDVIFKLCLSRNDGPALAKALRGQGVSCGEVVPGMAQMQRSGQFTNFKREVTQQRTVLETSVRCADGYLLSKPECDRAAADVAARAVALDTPATVLRRYR